MATKTKVTFTSRGVNGVKKVSFFAKGLEKKRRFYKLFKKMYDGQFYIPTESELNGAIANTPEYLRRWFMFFEGR
jgi:hypothetical protein